MKSKLFFVFVIVFGMAILPTSFVSATPFDSNEEDANIKYVFRSDYDQKPNGQKNTNGKTDVKKVVKVDSKNSTNSVVSVKSNKTKQVAKNATKSNSNSNVKSNSKPNKLYLSDSRTNYKSSKNTNKSIKSSKANKNSDGINTYIQPATDDSYDPETGDPRVTTITTTTTTTKTIRPLKVENIGSVEDREKERLRKLELKKIYSHTAEGFKQLQINTLGTTLVIDREEIERLRPNSVADLISNRSGIEIARKGSYQDDTFVMIQGSTPKQVLVLINNVPVSSALDAKNYLQDIPIEIVERVEITKNPQSVTYGSGANGGVINIFTGKTDKFGDVQLSYGDYNTGKLHGRARGAFNQDETVITVNGSVNISQGMEKVNAADKNKNMDSVQNMHFDVVFNQKITDTARFNLAFNYNNMRKDIAEVPYNIYKEFGIENLYAAAMPTQAQAKGQTDVYKLSLDRSQYGLNLDIGGDINSGWGMRFLASANLNTNIYSLRATDHTTLKGYAKLDNYFHNDYSRVSFGLDYNRNQLFEQKADSVASLLSSSNVKFKYKKYFTDSVGLYLQTRFDVFQYVSLFLGARYDLNPGKLKKLGGYSGNFGLVGHINSTNSLGLSAVLGHRLPTLLELYNLDNGNENLKPESNLSAELFWRYADLDGWYAGLIVFYRNDLARIYLDKATNLYSDKGTAQNVGGELYFGKKFDEFRFQFNLSGQYALDKKPKDWLALINSRFDFDYVGDNWSLGTGLNLATARKDGSNNLPLYALMNFKASWNFIAHWQLFAKVDFAMTKKYQTVYGYNSPSHYFEVGIKASF